MIRNVEYADRKKLQKTYLDGLRRYKCRGIPIIIDGEECPEKDWERIFEMSEDGGFYMGDYVGAEQGCRQGLSLRPAGACEGQNRREAETAGLRALRDDGEGAGEGGGGDCGCGA